MLPNQREPYCVIVFVWILQPDVIMWVNDLVDLFVTNDSQGYILTHACVLQ